MDSTASPKVKTMEGEKFGAHYLACNTLGVTTLLWPSVGVKPNTWKK